MIFHSDDYLRPPSSTSTVQFYSNFFLVHYLIPIRSILCSLLVFLNTIIVVSRFIFICAIIAHQISYFACFAVVWCLFFCTQKRDERTIQRLFFIIFALPSLGWMANSLVEERLFLANKNRLFFSSTLVRVCAARWCRKMLCGDMFMRVWCECESGRNLFRPRLRLMLNRRGWSEIEMS